MQVQKAFQPYIEQVDKPQLSPWVAQKQSQHTLSQSYAALGRLQSAWESARTKVTDLEDQIKQALQNHEVLKAANKKAEQEFHEQKAANAAAVAGTQKLLFPMEVDIAPKQNNSNMEGQRTKKELTESMGKAPTQQPSGSPASFGQDHQSLLATIEGFMENFTNMQQQLHG